MRSQLSLLGVLAVTACSGPPETDVGPSPLASVDKDRLYLLVRAGGGVKPICDDFFAAPTSPKTAAFNTECRAWQLMMLDHLRLNGISDLQAEHLRHATFWRWWARAQSEIADCREAVREQDRGRREAKDPGWRLPDTAAFRDCDPYDNAIQGEGKTLEDLGIRRARVSAANNKTAQ